MTDYADVAPALPLSPTGPQSYTYRLPDKVLATPANHAIVTIPFGHRRTTGIITHLHNKRPSFPAKTITVVSSVTLTSEQVLFARWLAKTMHGGLGYTLRLFKPPALSCPQPASYQASAAKSPDPALLKDLSVESVAIIDHNFKRRAALTRAIVAYYSRQHQVLTIVPEKSLLPGTGLAYQAGLRSSAVNAIWHGVRSGQVKAIRGTQKALFLPFQQLGLIIVEEEQSPAHKLWDQYPRLDNIDAVQALSRIHHCPVLYLSSFPSWRLSAPAVSPSMEPHALTLVVPAKAAPPPQAGLPTAGRTAESLVARHPPSANGGGGGGRSGIKISINRPRRLNTAYLSFSFNDKMKKYALPHALLLKLRAWSSAQKNTLLLYNRLDNKKIIAIMQANLSADQLSHCQLSTSRIFAHAQQSFDRLVWLFPEQSITFPDYRSVENAHIVVSRLQQLSAGTQSPVYLVTRQPPLIERIFQDPSLARTKDLRLRERLLLPPFAAQIRLKISATKTNLIMRKSGQIYTAIQDRINQLPPSSVSSILLRGPYALSLPPKDPKQQFIILRGPLDLLPDLYADLPVDNAELTPHRII